MTANGMVGPFPVLGYALIGLCVFGIGVGFGIYVYRLLRRADCPDVYFDRLLSERGKLRRDLAACRVELEDKEHELEREQEHSHRLVTDRKFYERHVTLADRLEREQAQLQSFDARA